MVNKTQYSLSGTTFSSTNYWWKMTNFEIHMNSNTNLVVFRIVIWRKNDIDVNIDANRLNEAIIICRKAPYLVYRSISNQNKICPFVMRTKKSSKHINF